MTILFLWCFWNSKHSKTYDFVICSCFWNTLESCHACSRLTMATKEFQRHEKITNSLVFEWFELQKIHKTNNVIGFWMVWASEAPENQKVIGFCMVWSFQASQILIFMKSREAWELQTLQKPIFVCLCSCFWSSNHLNTYGFFTFMMLWELKPFKNIWRCDLFMFLELYWSHRESRAGMAPKSSRNMNSHKVIGLWMVWASKKHH